MRKLIMKRGTGKTTALIHASAVTGYPILTETQYQRNWIVENAKALGLKIPEPIAMTQELRGLKLSNVLVDNAEAVLCDLIQKYIGANVIACALTADDDIIALDDSPGEEA